MLECPAAVYVTEACPCCGSQEKGEWPALVSPFVASYVLDRRPQPTRLLECKGCRFRWFAERFTEDEAARLYDGYRGDRYFQARHRHEPWYTRKVNDDIGGDPAVVSFRKAMVERIVRASGDASRIERVLDWGGDRGQILPEAIGKERFVYEISGLEPVPGVTRIGTADALRGQTFDLVLCCHVLEHLSDPRTVLDELRPLLRSKDSLLYVEVPFERPSLKMVGRGAAYRTWLSGLARVKPLLTAFDLYSTAFRTRLGTLPPLGFVKLHEHVSFFDERSLAALLERAGFTPVVTEKVDTPSPIGLSTVLVMTAKRKD